MDSHVSLEYLGQETLTGGVLSMVDLLVKVARFVKKVKFV
jgi:hypothetical protein